MVMKLWLCIPSRTGCLAADVTGEGPAAALLMANLQAAVRVTIHDAEDPADLLGRWNQLMYRNTHSNKFITCVLALIDPTAHRIDFALAGHCPPLLLRSDRDSPEELTAEPTYPLGVIEDAEFVTNRVEVGSPAFSFFCYTDGVTEAMDPEGRQFGLGRLVEQLGERRDVNPQVLIRQIRKNVAGFVAGASQSDDITMLAARVG